MSSTTIGNRVAGAIFFLLGSLFIFYLFYSQRLILDNYSFFFARYFKIISAAYGGIVLVFLGILYFIGFLIPYYKANTCEKAKNNIITSIFGLPFFAFLLITTSVSFNSSKIIKYKILGVIFPATMVMYCLWSFYSSFNTLKEFRKKRKSKGTGLKNFKN